MNHREPTPTVAHQNFPPTPGVRDRKSDDLVLTIVVGGALLFLVIAGVAWLSNSLAASRNVVRRVADQELQETRASVIQSLIRGNVIHTLDTGRDGVATVFVLRPFDDLLLEDKSRWMAICYAFAFAMPSDATPDEQRDRVLLICDARTGNQVAHYSGSFGLVFD